MVVPDNVQALVEAIDGGYRARFVLFWGHSGSPRRIDKECLSQWYPARFSIEGVEYRTAEHWMMAEKARTFGDDEALERLLASTEPDEAKWIGRQVRGFDRATWERHRFDAVVRGNLHKFGQNESLRSFLLGTEDQVLVEASPHDPIWGIGWDEFAPEAKEPRKWRGENLLGFALMQVRRQLATTTGRP